jgi:hypothetical protein
MRVKSGSVYRRCGCRDPYTGQQLGTRCPQATERWHGSWYLTVELTKTPPGAVTHRCLA